MTCSVYNVLVSPLFSEKAVSSNGAGKYVFKIAPDAGKSDVKRAIHKVFGIEAKRVHIISIPQKRKKFKGVQGVRSGFKKAIITLAPDVVLDMSSI